MSNTSHRYIASLTYCERQVLSLLSEGMSNRQISVSIGVSENTVKYHLKSIYVKLGVRHRLGAVMFATSIGLIQSAAREPAPSIEYVSYSRLHLKRG